MPIGAIQTPEVEKETKIKRGVEVTTLRLNRGGYFAGPDYIDPHAQPHSLPELPLCPTCGGRGHVSA
jgi:hypothetical protein